MAKPITPEWTENIAKEVFFNRFMHITNTFLDIDLFNKEAFKTSSKIAQALTTAETGYQFTIKNLADFELKYHGYDGDRPYALGRYVTENGTFQSDGKVAAMTQNVIKNSLPEYKKDFTKKEWNYLLDPDNFIRDDQYFSLEDVGKLDKRILPAEFYSSNRLAQTEEALYHYNYRESGDNQLKNVGLTSAEEEYIALLKGTEVSRYGQNTRIKELDIEELKKLDLQNATVFPGGLMTKEEKAQPPSPDGLNKILNQGEPHDVRNFIYDLNVQLDRVEAEMKSDRTNMKAVQSILNGAYHQKKPIHEIVSEQYSDTKVGQFFLNNESEYANDRNSRFLLRSFLTGEMNEGLILPTTTMDHSKVLLDRVSQNLRDSYDPSSGKYIDYHRAAELKTGYRNMMSDLYEARSVDSVDARLYLESDSRKRDGFFYDGEDKIAYDESIRTARMQEINDESYKAHQKAIQSYEDEVKARPEQPMNRFRNAFALNLLESTSDEAMAMAQTTEKELTTLLSEGNARFIKAQELLPGLEAELDKLEPGKKGYQEAKDRFDTQKQIVENRGYLSKDESLIYEGLTVEAQVEKSPGLSSPDVDLDYSSSKTTGNDISLGSYKFMRIATGYDVETDNGVIASTKGEITPLTYTQYNQKSLNTENEEKWITAMENGDRVRVSGSQVGYDIKSVNEGRVTLQKQHALASEAKVFMDITDEELTRIVDVLDERVQRSKVDQEIIQENSRRIVQEKFINLRYDQKLISEELRKGSDFVYEKLKDAEEHLLSKGMAPSYGVQEANISAKDIEKNYNYFRKDLSVVDQNKLKQSISLPSFLHNMAYSHAPWMTNNPAELMSNAEVALRTVLRDLAENQATIDLTDDALVKKWEKDASKGKDGVLTAEAEEAKIAYIDSLSTKGLKERMDDHLFMDVLHKTIQENFNPNGANKEKDGLLSIVNAAKETLEHAGISYNESDIYDELNNEWTNAEYKKFPFYREAQKLTQNDIKEMVNFSHSVVEVPSEHVTFASNEGNHASDFVDEFQELWADSKDYSSLDGQINKENIKQYGLKELSKYADDVERAYGNPQASLMVKIGNGDGSLADAIQYSVTKGDPDFDTEILSPDYVQKRKDGLRSQLKEGLSLPTRSDYDFLLDVAKEMDRESIEGVVQGQEATFYKGTKGEVLAHLHRDNKTVSIEDSSAGLTVQPHVNNHKPELFTGESKIKSDIGNPGLPSSGQLVPYDTLQGTGDFTLPTNPDVTIQSVKDVLSGKTSMTYLDIETTGLDGSTIDPKYIQPIEVFMQKAQWDADTGALRRNDDGEFIVKHGGRETVREIQLMTPLTDDTKEFLKQNIDGEDFTFRIGESTFDVAEYEDPTRKKEINAIIDSQPNKKEIHNDIKEKSDRLWFMRNIAKYAFPESEVKEGDGPTGTKRYRQYAGNDPIDPKLSKKFIEQLKDDAMQASEYLDTVGKPGGAKYSSVQVGTDMEGIVKHVSRFVGKSPVVGQNVANADWKKFMKIADDKLLEASAGYAHDLNSVFDQIDSYEKESFHGFVQDLETRLEKMDFATPEDKEFIGSFADNVYEWANGSTQTPGGAELPSHPREFLNQFIADAKESPDALASNVLASSFEKDMEGTVRTLNQAPKQRSNFTLEASSTIDAMRNSINEKGMVDATAPGLRDWMLDLGDNESTQQLSDSLSALDRSHQEYQRVNKISSSLPSPNIIEQQYLFDLVAPNAQARNAEAQFAEMGYKVDEAKGLHTGRTDVKNGLELVDMYAQTLSTDEVFEKHDVRNLQQGDVVELHKSVNKTSPLGMYTIQDVNATDQPMMVGEGSEERTVKPFSINMTDMEGQTHTIYGASGADLAQRTRNHLTFAGAANETESIENITNRFMQDQTRRQIERAASNADVFDGYGLNIGEIKETGELTHSPLKKMREHYDQIQDLDKHLESNGLPDNLSTEIVDKVARHNAPLFEGNAILDLENRKVSPTQKVAFEETDKWIQTNEAQARKGFLDEVRALKDTKAIDTDTAGNLIEQMNQAIKDEGFKRGAKRSVFNKANLGIMDERFGPKSAGESLVLDTQDTGLMSKRLWKLADDARQPGTEETKKEALERTVLPFLRDQGHIDTYEESAPPRMASVIRQLSAKAKDLPKYEEFDHLKSTELFDTDEDYKKFFEEKSSELLEPVKEDLTIVQRMKLDSHAETIAELKAKEMYHPQMNMIAAADIDAMDAFNFGKHGGIGTYQTDDLTKLAALLDSPEATKADVDTRNTLFGELFNRATGGARTDIDDVIAGGPSDQLKSMEALNWVTNNDGIYEANPNIAQHYMGEPGQYAGTKLGSKDLAYRVLDDIATQPSGKYTRGNNRTMLKNKIEAWKETGYEGKSKESPREELARRTELIKEAGASPKERRSTTMDDIDELNRMSSSSDTRRYISDNVDSNTNYKHTNPISDGISDVKSRVSNWATEFKEGGGSKATKWIAGLGAAAFAIHQFQQASSPVKLERKPMGHGVEGPTGQADDGLGEQPPTPNLQQGGKTYASSGEGSGTVKGHKVKVQGKASGDMNYEALNSEVSKSMGNFNVNMRDDRESIDRKWLEGQFSSYIDRGYAGDR